MNIQIAALLAQDGIINGAIYALLAIALVMVFTVTRVIFIPQGEFVTYGALTLAALQVGKVPGTVWVAAGLAGLAACMETAGLMRLGRLRQIPRSLVLILGWPAASAALALWAAPRGLSLAAQFLLSVAIVIPLGPLLYRVAYQPLADASVLVLLIVSVAAHFVLTGLALLAFGAEGIRTPALSDGQFTVHEVSVAGQSLWILALAAAAIVALALFFGRSLLGRALRATASNPTGARLIGFSPAAAGRLCFTVAAALGAVSGMLVGSVTTLYYDSGFLIGLKGFVAAIMGGLASYPLALAAALGVGLMESAASFWASEYKEIIVFTLLLPVLVWRSWLAHDPVEEAP